MEALATSVAGRLPELKELQIPSFTSWDRVGAVQGILADLEQGQFFDAARFVTQMMRDDRIRGCTNTRVYSVLGMPWHMEPAKHSREAKSKKLVDEATELWEQMCPEPEMAQLLVWALYLGMVPAQILTERDSARWIPSFQTWHPGAVWYDINANVYRLQYQGGTLELGQNSEDFILCTPFGYKYGRLNGLLSALAMPYLCRQWAFRDRARHSEVWGQPIKQIIAPAGATPAEVNAARRAVAVSGSETIIGSKQGEEGNKWDFKLHEVQSDGHEVFASQITHLDEAIAVVLQGQSMSTTGNPGLGAQASPGDLVRRDIMRFDAKVIGWVAGKLLGLWALKNYGDAALAPQLVVDIDPPEDEERASKVLVNLSTAFASFQATGVNVDVGAIMDEAGVPMLAGEPVTKPEPEPMPEATGPTADGAAPDEQAPPP